MKHVTIRAATTSDEPHLSVLATRLTAFELPPWRGATEISDADARAMTEAVGRGHSDDEVFIAERRGEPVGCLHVLLATDFFGRRHAHISVIAVSDTAEGSGVGRALMEYAEQWARRRGVALLTLNVFAANAHARRFYEKGGFVAEIVKYAKPL